MATKKKAGVLLGASDLKKRYPTSGLASVICLPDDKSLRLPSRVIAVNYFMGGGIPYGKILELFGEESTGKTLLAMDFAYAAQQLGGIVLWADAEATFDGLWAQKNGLDLEKIVLLPEENEIETISDWQADMIVHYREKLKNNEPILLVVDSTAALETRDNMEAADMDSGEDMGKRSKKIYQMLRKRNKFYARYGVCVIYINQLRSRPVKTQFEDPDTTPGGKAMRYYASIRMGLYRGKKIVNAKDKKVGNIVYIRGKKNKTAPPSENIKANVYFKPFQNKLGYDKYEGLQDLLLEHGILKRKSARWYYKEEQIAHGDLKMAEVLMNDEKMRKRLIRKLGVNTISQTKEKISLVGKNLYPVKLKAAADEKESTEK